MACDLEEFDLVSAVWIFSCNDENHVITYEGIRERLGLDASFDVRGLILKRRELFRPGAPPDELEEWQSSMRKGSRLPTWIALIEDHSKRVNIIDSLSQKDVFRSQFRPNRGSPKSGVEVLGWGLEHIDRIRKSKVASQEASAKSWQMWLVFFIGLANIIATIAVAVVKGNDGNQLKPVTTAVQAKRGQTTFLYKSTIAGKNSLTACSSLPPVNPKNCPKSGRQPVFHQQTWHPLEFAEIVADQY